MVALVLQLVSGVRILKKAPTRIASQDEIYLSQNLCVQRASGGFSNLVLIAIILVDLNNDANM